MTYDEWRGWVAYYNVSPFGEWREDVRTAMQLRQLFGDSEVMPIYPHVDSSTSLDDVLTAQRNSEQGLEEFVDANGVTRMRWKPGCGPLGT